MDHNFSHAYLLFEKAIPYLKAGSSLRERLNEVSMILDELDDGDFSEALPLRSNFRDLHRRLRRAGGVAEDKSIRSLDQTSESMLQDLCTEITMFFNAMNSAKYLYLRN